MVVGSGGDVWRILATRVHGTRLGRRSISGILRRRGLLRLLEAAIGTAGCRSITLLRLLWGIAGGTCVTGSAGSWVSGTIIGGVTSIWVRIGVVGRAVVLARLVGFRVAVLDSGSVARGLSAALTIPSRRIGFQVFDHGGGQVPVGGDVVALYDLAGLWVLVVARPHQGIVAQVAADVGRDDFAVDAIARDEVLVLAGGGRANRGTLVAGLS